MQAEAWVVPVGIAIGTAIVVPAAVWFGRRIYAAWHRHRVELLAKDFLTRAEFGQQFDRLAHSFETNGATQIAQHAENQKALDQLRMEGKEREGRIAGLFEGMRGEVRDENKDLRAQVGKVHSRVDSVFGILQDRRRN